MDWAAAPAQVPVFASMVFVVAFSSCLDVAAIEMDMGEPLDVNAELATVGYSNIASGLLGGFTGSYIFSQTIFTCRSGMHTRLVGMLVAAAEFTVVFLEVDLMAWVPLFFFSAMLTWIGFDLLAVAHYYAPPSIALSIIKFAVESATFGVRVLFVPACALS